jgi:hypothetical protein
VVAPPPPQAANSNPAARTNTSRICITLISCGELVADAFNLQACRK